MTGMAGGPGGAMGNPMQAMQMMANLPPGYFHSCPTLTQSPLMPKNPMYT